MSVEYSTVIGYGVHIPEKALWAWNEEDPLSALEDAIDAHYPGLRYESPGNAWVDVEGSGVVLFAASSVRELNGDMAGVLHLDNAPQVPLSEIHALYDAGAEITGHSMEPRWLVSVSVF